MSETVNSAEECRLRWVLSLPRAWHAFLLHESIGYMSTSYKDETHFNTVVCAFTVRTSAQTWLRFTGPCSLMQQTVSLCYECWKSKASLVVRWVEQIYWDSWLLYYFHLLSILWQPDVHHHVISRRPRSAWVKHHSLSCEVSIGRLSTSMTLVFAKNPPYQWKFQDPKMEVLYITVPYKAIFWGYIRYRLSIKSPGVATKVPGRPAVAPMRAALHTLFYDLGQAAWCCTSSGHTQTVLLGLYI